MSGTAHSPASELDVWFVLNNETTHFRRLSDYTNANSTEITIEFPPAMANRCRKPHRSERSIEKSRESFQTGTFRSRDHRELGRRHFLVVRFPMYCSRWHNSGFLFFFAFSRRKKSSLYERFTCEWMWHAKSSWNKAALRSCERTGRKMKASIIKRS